MISLGKLKNGLTSPLVSVMELWNIVKQLYLKNKNWTVEKMEFKTVKKVAVQKDKNKEMFYGMFNVAQDLGHSMSKQELIDIIKELDWAITQNVDAETYNTITKETLEQLEDIETFEN